MTTRPLKILELEPLGRGGLHHYAYNLARALAARGHDVTLVTAKRYELGSRSPAPGFTVIGTTQRVTGAGGRRWPASVLGLVRKIEALVDACMVTVLVHRLRPDVVHLHSTNQIALAYLILLRVIAIPVVVTAHVVTPHERSRSQAAIQRWIHRLGRAVIAHSDVDRTRLAAECRVDPARVAVVPHGEYGFFADNAPLEERSAARDRLGLDAGDESALFFGYIREYKGLDVLLDCWPTVVAARPRARLMIAGDPVRLPEDRRRALEAEALRLGAIARFAYVPFEEVSRYVAAADVMVLPYRAVSQSGVLYLALAMGLPVVATRVGALAEVLEDGENALIVPPDSAAELAAALIRLLGDPGLRARLAVGGRRLAERHSWPAIAAETEAVFKNLFVGS